MFPTLDDHAHLNPSRSPEEVSGCGAVLAMTLSLAQAELALKRNDSLIAWGVGCHPRFPRAVAGFNCENFASLAERTAIIGEVGLDGGSRVPMDAQLEVFRQVLQTISSKPRLVSIHAYSAVDLVLQELEHCPVQIPVLHWWTGNVPESKRAVDLGCYFSIHSAVARYSKFRSHVPLDRILVESDHGENDPPAAIPCRVQWVEYLVAQQYKVDVLELRKRVWANFSRLIQVTNCSHHLPELLRSYLQPFQFNQQ